MKNVTSALVVLSGGQDSTTCLFWARERFDRVAAVTFDYAQRHRCECDAARVVARAAGVIQHEVMTVGPLLRGRSPLTDPGADLETYRDFTSMDATIGDRVELTFVPMRNAFFLTLAANVAVAYGCFDLVTGVCQQDNANYPDCREVFIRSQEQTVNTALGIENFGIHAPLMNRSKADIVRLAQSLPGCFEAMAWTHTCYAGAFPPCGECHACVLRAHGFAQAGVGDPLLARAAG